MAKVVSVSEDSFLRDSIFVGDDIKAFSEHPFVDILDYIYAESTDNGEITLIRDGKEITVEYENEYGDTMGLSFDDSVEITPRNCANNCIFCFVAQLPKNLRKTLYVKDDDYRLSFISGSYITGTNLSEKDIQRIIDYRLSPLYVSVHATDRVVQKKLLGIKKDFDQMALIRRLVGAGIRIHTQIVMVGGMNDGEILKKSLFDLYEVGVESVAIVPVGLTGHRDSLPNLLPITKEQARDAIDICENFYKEHEMFCWCSDEMYQRAEWDVPSADYYGNFDQIENGVGLIAQFFEDFQYELEDCPKRIPQKSVGIFTGVSGEGTIVKAKKILEEKYRNLSINVYPVRNDFFGNSVTVTGLVTATDIIKQYGNLDSDAQYFIIPSVMLKEFGNQFLDNMTVEELSEKLHKKILVSQASGDGFVRAVVRGIK